MSSSQISPASSARAGDDTRTLVIICYALYFAFFVSGVTPLIGVIVAYVKRGDARGTIWESHFDNLITVFWVALILCLILVPLWIFVVGASILTAAAAWPASIFAFPFILVVICFPFSLLVLIWYLYRTVKGFVRALDGKPYS
jgi:uncharacterized membrane protein